MSPRREIPGIGTKEGDSSADFGMTKDAFIGNEPCLEMHCCLSFAVLFLNGDLKLNIHRI